MRPDRADLWVGLFVLGLGVLAGWQATEIPASPLYAQVGPHAVPYAVAALLALLGTCLVGVALLGGWSRTLEAEANAPATNWRALLLMVASIKANLALIGWLGFSAAASAQFVLVAAAFGSRRPWRDAGLALMLTLFAWFGFVQLLGVNIGAGLLEEVILRLFGMDVP